jgi:hypothetical protein
VRASNLCAHFGQLWRDPPRFATLCANYEISIPQPVRDVPVNAQFNDFALEPSAAVDRVARSRLGPFGTPANTPESKIGTVTDRTEFGLERRAIGGVLTATQLHIPARQARSRTRQNSGRERAGAIAHRSRQTTSIEHDEAHRALGIAD